MTLSYQQNGCKFNIRVQEAGFYFDVALVTISDLPNQEMPYFMAGGKTFVGRQLQCRQVWRVSLDLDH
jgi:hypothetical protein